MPIVVLLKFETQSLLLLQSSALAKCAFSLSQSLTSKFDFLFRFLAVAHALYWTWRSIWMKSMIAIIYCAFHFAWKNFKSLSKSFFSHFCLPFVKHWHCTPSCNLLSWILFGHVLSAPPIDSRKLPLCDSAIGNVVDNFDFTMEVPAAQTCLCLFSLPPLCSVSLLSLSTNAGRYTSLSFLYI